MGRWLVLALRLDGYCARRNGVSRTIDTGHINLLKAEREGRAIRKEGEVARSGIGEERVCHNAVDVAVGLLPSGEVKVLELKSELQIVLAIREGVTPVDVAPVGLVVQAVDLGVVVGAEGIEERRSCIDIALGPTSSTSVKKMLPTSAKDELQPASPGWYSGVQHPMCCEERTAAMSALASDAGVTRKRRRKGERCCL